MQFKMAQGSMFAVLLRSPWWYSALIGLFIVLISLFLVSGQYAILVISLALPFFGIAGYAAYKQSQQPSQKRMLEVAQEARELTPAQINAKIVGSYTKVGFESSPFKGAAAEVELTRSYHKLLLSSKRFKAANVGIEQLKQLVAAGENAEATGYLYVTLGASSDTARAYADENDIELVQIDRLAAFFDGQAKIE